MRRNMNNANYRWIEQNAGENAETNPQYSSK